jgi:hypothetical protein
MQPSAIALLCQEIQADGDGGSGRRDALHERPRPIHFGRLALQTLVRGLCATLFLPWGLIDLLREIDR